jgi:hypothetical protein
MSAVRNVLVLADKRPTFVAALQTTLNQVSVSFAKAAALFVALMTPAAMIALALGLWRLTADLGWTDEFLVSDGFFSHWQVWILLAMALKRAASTLAVKTASSAKGSDILSLGRPSPHVLPR